MIISIVSIVSSKAFETKHPIKPHGWKSEEVYKRNLSIYNRFILPSLKTFNINDIEPPIGWNNRNYYP